MDMLAGWLKTLSAMARAAVVLLATILLVTPFVAAVVALAGGNAVAAWGTLASGAPQFVQALAILALDKYLG